MEILQALLSRKSTRAFLEREVSRESIVRILDGARWAPSGVNTQPWQVAVVTGTRKQRLQSKLEQAFREGHPAAREYSYYPETWMEPYKSRRFACGIQLYGALGIKRQDKERRRDQWAANYRAFDAPAMLLFFIAPELEKGSYLDYGLFLQSIMLMAVSEGLASCPQAALGDYPGIVKTELGYDDQLILLGGMALGYEDPEAPVNGYRTPREPVDAFTRFFHG